MIIDLDLLHRQAIAHENWVDVDAATTRLIGNGVDQINIWQMWIASAYEARQYAEAYRRWQVAAGRGHGVALAASGLALGLANGQFQQVAGMYREAFGHMHHQTFGVSISIPRWDGHLESFNGKRVLIWSSNAAGDLLFLQRYLPEIRRRAASVTARAIKQDDFDLYAPHADRVVNGITATGAEYDLVLWAFELFALCETCVAPSHGSLVSDAQRNRMQAVLGASTVPTIGICWTAGETMAGPYARSPNGMRSIPDDALMEPIFRLAHEGVIRLVSLTPAKTGKLAGLPVLDIGSELTGFGATEAAIECCDAVVSVDTSVANLAGAMGKPLLALVPFVHDWKWGDPTVGTTPWYPSAKVYQQPWAGCWWMPVAQVADDLRKLAATSQHHRMAA